MLLHGGLNVVRVKWWGSRRADLGGGRRFGHKVVKRKEKKERKKRKEKKQLSGSGGGYWVKIWQGAWKRRCVPPLLLTAFQSVGRIAIRCRGNGCRVIRSVRTATQQVVSVVPLRCRLGVMGAHLLGCIYGNTRAVLSPINRDLTPPSSSAGSSSLTAEGKEGKKRRVLNTQCVGKI